MEQVKLDKGCETWE